MLKTSNDQRKLLPNFDQLFATTAQAPGGVARLRELILTLAVQGRLVPQDASDEPASELLKKIRMEKDRLIVEGKIKKDKPLAEIAEEEKPFELPVGWEWIRLGDLVRVLNGRAYKKQELLEEGPVPVLRVGNLFTSNHWYYSDLELDEDKYCSDGELIYSWSASFGPFIWSGPKAIYHYHIWKLDPWSLNNFDHEYLHHFLLDKTAEIKAAGHGISMAHMTKEKMEKLVVAYPPLAEQSRIVTRVEELMCLCDALEEKGRLEHTQHQQLLQALLDSLTQTQSAQELARHWQRLAQHFDLLIDRPEAVDALEQTILQLAVRGLLVEQDAKDEPAIKLIRKIKEEKINIASKSKAKKSDRLDPKDFICEIPEKWVWTELQEVTLIGPENGLSPKPSNIETKYKCLMLTSTTSGEFKSGFYKYVDISEKEAESNYLKKNDLLIQRGNSIDYVGIAAIYNDQDDEFIYPDLMMRLRLSSQVDLKYVHLYLISKDGRSYFRSVATGTQGNMPKVNQTAVNSAPIPLPPLAEQSRIVARVTELRALCQQLREKLTQARSTQTQLAQAWVEQAAA
ncbi:restriction endonuclease subunit S [Comamonas testosteroni]|uniref:restriction endonuclease subunit S n=1 Tax=Comamonas testosteroni TaxID=285 RepID=UPI0023AA90A1|nr:restriction endonuclease subunit S [Comamonas testosteroni]WEE75847.1 restriction endonuclease subunit S [Comamonas testosteroni]